MPGPEAAPTGEEQHRTGPAVARAAGLAAGPVLFAAILAAPLPWDMPGAAEITVALVLWMVAWWVTQAVPIAVTSLLPLLVLPLSGVMRMTEAAAPYADPVIFLMLGGFIIAVAIEKHGLHRRMAFGIMTLVGLSPGRLLLGMMLATAFLSMWISNTATVMIMVPLVLAVTSQLPTEEAGGRGLRLAPALLLGVAFAGSAGGMATLIGSPPNAIMAGIAEASLGRRVGFGEWFVFAIPLTVVLLAAIWLLLALMMRRCGVCLAPSAAAAVRREREALGPMSRAEWLVLAVFAAVALVWVARPFLLEDAVPALTDGMVAVAGAILLFIIPQDLGRRRFLLHWEDTKNVNYGVLLLMGGGLSLAAAFQSSGLGDYVAQQMIALSALPRPLVLLILAAATIVLTNVASNTAMATLLIPIAISLGGVLGASPLSLMATVAVSASAAFVLPVATPPNAVVFASGGVTVGQMARTGVILSVIAALVVSAVSLYWLPLVFR